MRALIQRVTEASVSINNETVGAIGPGLVVLLGVSKEDDEGDTRYLVEKISNLRIFADDTNRFNLSASEIGAGILVVSQFTLYGDSRKGRRPDFNQAAVATDAKRLYEHAVQLFQEIGLVVATGRFQEHMLVKIQNDGPVTIMLDSSDRHKPRRG